MKEPIAPFEMPTQPPSLGTEDQGELADLIYNALPFDESLAVELAFLVRKYVAVRSALGFAKERAQVQLEKLKKENDQVEIYRCQGRVDALEQLASVLLHMMQETEKPKETPQ